MVVNQRDILVVPVPGQLVDPSAPTLGNNEGVVVSITAHGFSVGNILRGTVGGYALASSAGPTPTAGRFMVSDIIDANNVRLKRSGENVTIGGFTEGDILYLGNGVATATAPTAFGDIDQVIGQYKGGQIWLDFNIAQLIE